MGYPRGVSLLLAALLVPAAHAGLFGTDAPSRIPVPAREFHLRIEDRGGVVLDVTRATFDGEIFVYGTIGLAQVTVPFENIDQLEVLPGGDEDHRVARVLTRGSETIELVVESDTPFWGRTTFGNYKIEIGQVHRVSVQ